MTRCHKKDFDITGIMGEGSHQQTSELNALLYSRGSPRHPDPRSELRPPPAQPSPPAPPTANILALGIVVSVSVGIYFNAFYQLTSRFISGYNSSINPIYTLNWSNTSSRL